jgi:flagellar biogenesis protein FliO
MTANASPEPFSNIFLSIVEDMFTIGLAAVTAFHPVAILVIILAFILLLLWLGPKIFRAICRMLGQVGAILGGAHAST